jgi:hypothetical protein
MSAFPYALVLVSYFIGALALWYGVRDGLLQRRIVVSHKGRVARGREAVAYGVFYCLTGVLFLAGGSAVALSLLIR